MSTVDDIRKLFQDLIAPELRSLSVRLDAFEKRMDERFAALDQRVGAVEERIGAVERQISHRFEVLDQRLWTNQTQTIDAIHRLSDYDRLAQRVSAIEEQKEPQTPRSGH